MLDPRRTEKCCSHCDGFRLEPGNLWSIERPCTKCAGEGVVKVCAVCGADPSEACCCQNCGSHEQCGCNDSDDSDAYREQVRRDGNPW